jgi:hypothetical protein
VRRSLPLQFLLRFLLVATPEIEIRLRSTGSTKRRLDGVSHPAMQSVVRTTDARNVEDKRTARSITRLDRATRRLTHQRKQQFPSVKRRTCRRRSGAWNVGGAAFAYVRTAWSARIDCQLTRRLGRASGAIAALRRLARTRCRRPSTCISPPRSPRLSPPDFSLSRTFARYIFSRFVPPLSLSLSLSRLLALPSRHIARLSIALDLKASPFQTEGLG